VSQPITPAQQQMYDAIVNCFDACQGMARHSIGESDRYWELAEFLMEVHGKSIGQPVLRAPEQAAIEADGEAAP
jgi:hypothetical protein